MHTAIYPPDQDLSLDIAPPKGFVFAYRFHASEERDVLVFATSLEEAMAIYADWNLDADGYP